MDDAKEGVVWYVPMMSPATVIFSSKSFFSTQSDESRPCDSKICLNFETLVSGPTGIGGNVFFSGGVGRFFGIAVVVSSRFAFVEGGVATTRAETGSNLEATTGFTSFNAQA